MVEPEIHQDCMGREEEAVEHLAEHDAVSYSQFEELARTVEENEKELAKQSGQFHELEKRVNVLSITVEILKIRIENFEEAKK